MGGVTVRLRAEMASLPAYVPGRKVAGAVVLASNESPYGLLPSVAGLLADATAGVSRYPDMGATRLVDAIAEHHGVSADRVAVGAGSVEVCGQLAAATVEPGGEVVYGWRAFEAYPIITAVAGGTAVRVPLGAGHVHDVDAMVAAVSDRMLDEMAAAGPLEEVRQRVELLEKRYDHAALYSPSFTLPAERVRENTFAVIEAFAR
jgi:histidinol-phosphate aminotransferase